MIDRKSLLPPNSTDMELAIEQGGAHVSDIQVLIRTLWDADTCPSAHLGYLAWALSVDVWNGDWDETTKRNVIRQSIPIHRYKGTIGAVRRALGAIGVEIDITEWFESSVDDDALPHTFRLDAFADQIFAGGLGINNQFLELVRKEVDMVKPVRSHYHVRIGDKMNSGFHGRTGTRSRVRSKVMHELSTRIETRSNVAQFNSGVRQRIITRIEHDIQRQGVN